MDFIKRHLTEVAQIASDLDADAIEELINQLAALRENKGRLFIIGVGGSAGNASHAVNDFRKLAGIEAYAPTDNISELTARTNDEGWETVFKAYLLTSRITFKDAILVLSVGGGDREKNISANICAAIDYAKSQGAKIYGIVGKPNGYTHINADVCILVPPVNPTYITPHSESFQAIIWHLLVSHPKLQVQSTKW